MDDLIEFYNQLAAEYHLVYADWERSIGWQSEIIDRIIKSYTTYSPLSLLDCSCGIGTQAIGMAMRGYRVFATDISPKAVKRLIDESANRGVQLETGIADMRSLDLQVAARFDVVISCDNAVPHLLSDADLRLAIDSMRKALKDDGLALISIRDYDQAIRDHPRIEGPRLLEGQDGRRVVFQVWDWAENGHTYTVHQFVLKESVGEWITRHFSTSYRALLRAELTNVLAGVGFKDIIWLSPEQTGYHQPIVVARR